MNTYKFMVINKTNATEQNYFDVNPDSMFLTEEMMIEIAKQEQPNFSNETHFLIVSKNGKAEYNTPF